MCALFTTTVLIPVFIQHASHWYAEVVIQKVPSFNVEYVLEETSGEMMRSRIYVIRNA